LYDSLEFDIDQKRQILSFLKTLADKKKELETYPGYIESSRVNLQTDEFDELDESLPFNQPQFITKKPKTLSDINIPTETATYLSYPNSVSANEDLRILNFAWL